MTHGFQPAKPASRSLGVWKKGQLSKALVVNKNYVFIISVGGNQGPIPRYLTLLKPQYVEPSKENEKVVVKPSIGVREKECNDRELTLVGHFIGQRLSHLIVNAIAWRFWGVEIA